MNGSKVNNGERRTRTSNQNQNQSRNQNLSRKNSFTVEKNSFERIFLRCSAKQPEHSSPRKPDRVVPVEHQPDRVIYIDEPRPKPPSAATKAFVRNLSSNSVAQHMSWDSESLYTQRTNSDLFVLFLVFVLADHRVDLGIINLWPHGTPTGSFTRMITSRRRSDNRQGKNSNPAAPEHTRRFLPIDRPRVRRDRMLLQRRNAFV